MKVLVTGGTGFLGTELIYQLVRENHEVYVLTRKQITELSPAPFEYLTWPLNENAKNKVLNCEVVINLAGESIANKRWSREQKTKIIRSRVELTEKLVEILQHSKNLKTFISSSAIGYYGDRGAEVLAENSAPGVGFLAEVCKAWEEAALKINVRAVLLRTGIVLSRFGGAMLKLEELVKNNLGGKAGSGNQYMSWIHAKDWVRAVLFCINNNQLQGAVNLVAPTPVTNSEFMQSLSGVMGKGFQIGAPKLAIEATLGEMSELVLGSQNVIPEQLLKNKFEFHFSMVREALEHLFQVDQFQNTTNDCFFASQWVPAPIDKVFEFFSDAQNLGKITPPEMGFNIKSMSTPEIQEGTIIKYDLKIHKFPVEWVTRIKNWEPPYQFTDTQESGPYQFWHHTHLFESLASGTLMKDVVIYKLPLGRLGRTFGIKLVKKDIEKIFSYRKVKILEQWK